MKKLLVCFLFVVGCQSQDYNSTVSVNHQNGDITTISVRFMGNEVFLKNKEDVNRFKKNLQSLISELNYAEESMVPYEQKNNSKQIPK